MDQLKYIFKSNPSLLETKEVKDLIAHVQSVHERNSEISERQSNTIFEIHGAVIHSNRYMKDVYSDKECIDRIDEILKRD